MRRGSSRECAEVGVWLDCAQQLQRLPVGVCSFAEGSDTNRRLCRPFVIDDGFGEVVRIRRAREVFSQLCSMHIEVRGVTVLQHARHLLVQSHPTRSDHLLVQRLAEQRVSEAIPQRARPRVLMQPTRAQSLLDRRGQAVLAEAGDALQHAHVEFAADDGGNRQELERWRAQSREALADDGAQPFGDSAQRR